MNNFFRFVVVLSIFVFASCSTTKSLNKYADVENWERLYNEKNLYGWDLKFAGEELNVNYKNTFLCLDSILRVQYNEYETFEDKYAHLYYHKPYSYYKLRFEYRFFGEQVPEGASWNVRNSGVMVHSQSAQSNDFEQDFPVSIELQLLGGLSNGVERTTGNMCSPGTNVVYQGELDETHCISSNSKTYHGDQWVAAEMIVLGDSIIHHIIEQDTVLTYTHPQIDDAFIANNDSGNGWRDFGVFSSTWDGRQGELLSSGFIALQAESHPIDFKNIRLLNLVGCMDKEATNYKEYYLKSDASSCIYQKK